MGHNSKKALYKTITWRLISSGLFFIVALFFMDNAKDASAITMVDAVIKTIAYYVHELSWQGRLKKSKTSKI